MPTKKQTPKVKQDPKAVLTDALLVQGLLLGDDELLIYKDEHAEYHVIVTKPYDSSKEYKTIFMTWEDLPKENQKIGELAQKVNAT